MRLPKLIRGFRATYVLFIATALVSMPSIFHLISQPTFHRYGSVDRISLRSITEPDTGTNPTCNYRVPTSSTDKNFPLTNVTPFRGSTYPYQNFQDYGYREMGGGGFIATNHHSLVNNTLIMKGYPDPNNTGLAHAGYNNVPGAVGSGFDLKKAYVANSGGFDVCFSMSQVNWQGVHLAILSWPTSDNWDEGETDIFEGNPQVMKMFIHPITTSPNKTAVFRRFWPASLSKGIHMVSGRWDSVHGYSFYLDGALVANAPLSKTIKPTTTPHHLSIQMQDLKENSSSSEYATIYWAATYGHI